MRNYCTGMAAHLRPVAAETARQSCEGNLAIKPSLVLADATVCATLITGEVSPVACVFRWRMMRI